MKRIACAIFVLLLLLSFVWVRHDFADRARARAAMNAYLVASGRASANVSAAGAKAQALRESPRGPDFEAELAQVEAEFAAALAESQRVAATPQPRLDPHMPRSLIAFLVLISFLVPISLSLVYRNSRDRREQSRRERGLCIHCGYDIRHTRVRCPECGRDPSSRL